MKPFKLYNAKTISEATAKLAEYKSTETAKPNAGGSDLLGTLKDNVWTTYPTMIVSLKAIPNMDYIKVESGTLKIGAMAKLVDIANSTVVKGNWSILADAAYSVATAPIQNIATLGGNICQNPRCWYWRSPKSVGRTFNCLRKGGTVCFAVTGDNRHHSIFGKGCFAPFPSDTAVALGALNAQVKITGTSGDRTVSIMDFYNTLGNVLKLGEIVTEVQVPTPAAGTKQTYIKFRTRKAMDFAIVSVASAITTSGGKVSDSRIVLGAVSTVPYRATKAEAAIKDKTITETIAIAAGEAAVEDAVALSHNSYKIQIAKTLVKRAILA